MPDQQDSQREGFALPLALVMLIIIAGLLAGVFTMSTQTARIGNNIFSQERALRASELGLNQMTGTWVASRYNGLATGGSVTKIHDSSSAGYTADVRVMRLNDNTFLVTSTGSAGSGTTLAKRRTETVVRLVVPQVTITSAVMARGPITIAGSTYINGADAVPDGWSDCGALQPTLPGVMVQNVSDVSLNGCTNLRCIDGDPAIATSTVAGDTSAYFNFGDMDWAGLTAAATMSFSAADYTLTGMAPSFNGDGSCRTTDRGNWGDMRRAAVIAGECEDYFPIIYFAGRTSQVHLTGGQGQGMLIVEGDLEISGGFTWTGPVITRGHFESTGTGAHVYGAVLAGNADVESNSLAGNAVVNYSSCAIAKAVAGAAVAKQLTTRPWADLF
jgi:hypothetical protein